MVKDHVNDHSHSKFVSAIDKLSHHIWGSILRMNCEELPWIISPRLGCVRKLGHWHEFESSEPESSDVIELFDRGLKCPLLCKRAYVHFIDNVFVERARFPVGPSKRLSPIGYHAPFRVPALCISGIRVPSVETLRTTFSFHAKSVEIAELNLLPRRRGPKPTICSPAYIHLAELHRVRPSRKLQDNRRAVRRPHGERNLTILTYFTT
mmetsp:Transcript_18867/g.75802  ORF Transcript_18867/g.75802 Transcript_18867/m.75802 type:complete len:208 (-) Transcript_18867:89-712(-)